ncbi:hypothetical protein DPEC_G00243710 [Dallia pectoralis]|uniref:Uncharacterized protein n=1 Tax=Dallia pectoralis TaxID=75939 RepID=A0ACC2FVT3_DALPE|nr:hypothetical protein DPEC_G00243710 [Dallia pectoralis]
MGRVMKLVKMRCDLSLQMLILGLLSILLLCPGCRAADVPEDPTVALALGMVELGARGASQTEIRQAVGFSHLPTGAEFPLLQKLIQELSEDGHQYVIQLANSLFLQSGVPIKPDFQQMIRKYFKAEVETVDFSKSSAVAAQINGWVENHTRGKIRDLFSADDFSCRTMITLVNAVYFRGSWKTRFNLKETHHTTFTKENGIKIQTPMMYQMGDFNYEENSLYQVLEMPYEGEDMSMLIVLPRQEVPRADLEPYITAPSLEKWANNLKRQKVKVYLPRFRVEQTVALTQTLKALGIKRIFTGDADLSAMTPGGIPACQKLIGLQGEEKPYINEAVHKAYLEVTEDGAEGAAATGFTGHSMPLPMPPLHSYTFKADHPFFLSSETGRWVLSFSWAGS